MYSLNTLFNYPRFIKCLNTNKISLSVGKWVTIRTEITRRYVAMHSIFKPLLKTIIESENNANLHTFEVVIQTNLCKSIFKTTYELILQILISCIILEILKSLIIVYYLKHL